LKTNEQIKQFLKMRFSIILKSYAQQKKLLQQPLSESNIPFSKTKHFLYIKHFIESECELIESIIEFLN